MDPEKVWIRDRVGPSKPRLASRRQQPRPETPCPDSTTPKKYDSSPRKHNQTEKGKKTRKGGVREGPSCTFRDHFLFTVKKSSGSKYERIFQ